MKLSWVEMMQAHPACHLVVGVADPKLVPRPGRLIERLLEIIRPHGRYAVTLLREAERPVVYCAFEDKADADRLAGAIHARDTAGRPGWASQRMFRLNTVTATAIAAALNSHAGMTGTDRPASAPLSSGRLRVR
jgi:hypothetical protein